MVHTPSLARNLNLFLHKDRIDFFFIIFCFLLSFYYAVYISLIQVPIHDGAVYLLNAKSWLYNTEIYQEYRPQLLSWIISAVWLVTGENWVITQYIQPAFTVGAGVILYLLFRKYKGRLFAFGVAGLTMLNMVVFAYSTQIITEGLALFFLVLTLYFLKSQKENYWFLAGITIGLTFASRYPIILQALTIFIVESIVTKKPALVARTVLGALPVIAIVILVMHLKTGEFQMGLSKDTNFTIYLSPFYLANSINIWGFAFLLLPICLLYKRTYKDKYNYVFIVWFAFSIIFWSANLTNHQYRFAIQFTPAVYFLSILGVENLLYYLKRREISKQV